MIEIFLAKDYTYLRTIGMEAGLHTHIALQVSFASPLQPIRSEGLEGLGLYFRGGEPHSILYEGTLHTFLLNPVIDRSRLLSRSAPKSLNFSLPEELSEELAALPLTTAAQPALNKILNRALAEITDQNCQAEPLDGRIAEAIAHIDELEQKRIAAGELAEQLALSESRFLHLFKAELHTTVRKYLLWRRTSDGAKLVAEGASITEAAHATGFTDSAHFARVFKQMYGLTLSAALGGEPGPLLVIGDDF